MFVKFWNWLLTLLGFRHKPIPQVIMPSADGEYKANGEVEADDLVV